MKKIAFAFGFAALTALSTFASAAHAANATAVFAGGCFWCTESDFEKLAGVVSAESGYIGGTAADANYPAVSAGGTRHTEAVRVTYDPSKVSYAQLVDYFWPTIDPTEKDRQFCDVGSQYRTGIYWSTDAERQTAEASKAALLKAETFKNIYTEIERAQTFYPAEDYHQDYYKKNAVRYKFYRYSCGRDAQLERVWKTSTQ